MIGRSMTNKEFAELLAAHLGDCNGIPKRLIKRDIFDFLTNNNLQVVEVCIQKKDG